MESVQTIIQTIFGGQITVQGLLTVLVSLYAVVMSIVEWRAKVKLIKADKQLTSADKKLDAQQEEINQVKESLKYLGDIICTAYLANVNIDEATKKKIAVAATSLEQVASIKFSENTEQLINTITTYVPGTNIEEKKEEIIAEVKASEQIINAAAETADDIVSKLEV